MPVVTRTPVYTADARVMRRFWAKTRRNGNGCIEWTGWCNKAGYGDFAHFRIIYRAHRWIYAQLNPWTFVQHLDVHHECNNQSCVNPAHLRQATRSENLLLRPPQQLCKRGHLLDGENVRVNRNGSRQCKSCVRLVRHENYWSDVSTSRAYHAARARRYRANRKVSDGA